MCANWGVPDDNPFLLHAWEFIFALKPVGLPIPWTLAPSTYGLTCGPLWRQAMRMYETPYLFGSCVQTTGVVSDCFAVYAVYIFVVLGDNG